jgi:H/ACA ribonucleoprotein complex subunit 2
MAKERSTDKEEGKREKHSKKEKRSEKDGVHKTKKVKSEKKKAPDAEDTDVTTKLLNALEEKKPSGTIDEEKEITSIKIKTAPLLGALVPFAHPLADEKIQKKVLKSVKKGPFKLPLHLRFGASQRLSLLIL